MRKYVHRVILFVGLLGCVLCIADVYGATESVFAISVDDVDSC